MNVIHICCIVALIRLLEYQRRKAEEEGIIIRYLIHYEILDEYAKCNIWMIYVIHVCIYAQVMNFIIIIGPLGTSFSEILIGIYTFSSTKMHLKMSSGKWRPSWLDLNGLLCCLNTYMFGFCFWIDKLGYVVNMCLVHEFHNMQTIMYKAGRPCEVRHQFPKGMYGLTN